MSLLSIALVVAGIVLLYAGGETLIRGAVDLAKELGLSTLVIGLTVVAFATSAPELAATLMASLRGASSVAIGNVLGSNVANIGLILGISAFLQPLRSNLKFVQREVPIMIGASLLLYPLMGDLTLSRWDGGVMFASLLLYLVFILKSGASTPTSVEAGEIDPAARPLWQSLALVVGGVVLLVAGAWALVEGAVHIARALGISERVIGLTMVAFGTSLPELASSIAAARHGHADIVLGNIIGSNIFNVLGILGVTAMVRPIPIEATVMRLDFWIMIGFSLVVFPFHWPDMVLTRWKGAVLLVAYLGYMGYLFA